MKDTMYFGILELILLVLSGSAFVMALCLLTWVLVKGRFLQGPLDDRRSDYKQKVTSHCREVRNKVTSATPTSSYIPSPDGSAVSECMRQHILASHPHFWEHLEKQDTSTYGSFTKEPVCTGLHSNIGIYERKQDLSYGTLKFQFLQLKSPETDDSLFQLLFVQALKINFCLKDLYIEVKCHVSSQNSLDVDDLFELLSPKTNGRRRIIPRFLSNGQHKLKRQFGEYRFTIPLSQMRTKNPVGKVLIFTGRSQEATKQVDDHPCLTFDSQCYMKRGKDRVYLGKGVVTDWPNCSLTSDNGVQTKETQKDGMLLDLCMDYIHEPRNTVGSVLVSLTYLPTSEKLTVCIKEFSLQEEVTSQITGADLYWKIKLIKMDSNVVKRKVTVNSNDITTTKWSCDKVVTFDRTKSTSLGGASLVCRLMARKVNHTSTRMYSNRTPDRVHYRNENITILDYTKMKHLDTMKGEEMTNDFVKGDLLNENTISKSKPCNNQAQKTCHYRSTESLDSEVGKKTDMLEMIVGELFIGPHIPDVECRELWVHMLVNSRSAVQRWLTII